MTRGSTRRRCGTGSGRPVRVGRGAVHCAGGGERRPAQEDPRAGGRARDTAESREVFRRKGLSASLVRCLTADVLPGQGAVVDIGCGTGYYLAGVLDQLPGARGLGLDASVRALRSAARAHLQAAAASWDVFRPLPLVDQAVDVMLNVFAPRNPSEFHRVLRPTGRLIVVRPIERHLAELRGQIPAMITIDPDKEQRLHQALDPYFEAAGTQHVEYTAPLTRQEAIDLVGMTPSARHLTHADLTDQGPLPAQVTVSVLATSYRPR
ncbi:methyltransferase domain-containing protein [Streptomyces sp. enrichment culture]|uniref:methyltransferase domain-containing protein n=1 Tax=Streptomyces sp. enrichment culture TaxID=1795815 RepID=UPI003F5548C0